MKELQNEQIRAKIDDEITKKAMEIVAK